MTNYEECNRAGAKSQLAYERAKNACISAWGQGVRQEPLNGDALLFAELGDAVCDAVRYAVPIWSRNIVREKYQRGRERRPYEG